MIIEMLHTVSIVIPVLFSIFGTSLGQARIGEHTIEAIDSQPEAYAALRKASIIGLAITETAAILGLVVSILFLLNPATEVNMYYASFGRMGIAIALGISGLMAGIMSAKPVIAACISTARQPFFSGKIINVMFITQTLIMTPNVFGFLIALLIRSKLPAVDSLVEGLQLLSAGIAVGIGSIGPSIGLSTFAYAACIAVGKNKKVYSKILSLTFVTEAMIETPAIFSLLISLSIINLPISSETDILRGIACLAAGSCMGVSSIAAGISSGRTGAAACAKIAEIPEMSQQVSKLNILALALIDSFPIYGLIIAITLLYVT
jgi:F-type H+-transporting ATPase subunit c